MWGEHGLVAICRSPLAATGQKQTMVTLLNFAMWLAPCRPPPLFMWFLGATSNPLKKPHIDMERYAANRGNHHATFTAYF